MMFLNSLMCSPVSFAPIVGLLKIFLIKYFHFSLFLVSSSASSLPSLSYSSLYTSSLSFEWIDEAASDWPSTLDCLLSRRSDTFSCTLGILPIMMSYLAIVEMSTSAFSSKIATAS